MYVGTTEVGNNAGPEVARFLRSVGLGTGYAYCAAFVSFCLTEAEPQPVWPTIRTARAQSFITAQSMRASHVMYGYKKPKPGDILVWKKGNTGFGHVGFVLEWDGACGTTVEANTSSGVYGSQRDGDGVWIRKRCIEPANYFRVVSFTPVRYK